MLNKKNIAIAMAAATVAMPMTQSFAAVVESDQTEAIKAMKEKALELMNKKFTDNESLLINTSVAGEKIFKVQIVANGNDEWYTSYAEFARDFDEAYNDLEDGETIKINYDYAQRVDMTDEDSEKIGYSTLADGTIVDFDTNTYTQGELDTKAGDNDATQGELDTVKVGDVQYKEDEDDKTRTYQVRLTDGKDDEKRFANIKAGDIELDFEKPMLAQEDGYYVDIDGDSIIEVNDEDAITLAATGVDTYTISLNGTLNTKLTENAVIDGFYPTWDIDADKAETPAIVSDVIKKGSTLTSVNSSKLFNSTEGRLTTEGNQLLSRIQELTYDLHGVNYNVKVTEPVASKEIKIVIEKKAKTDANFKKVEEIKIVKDTADRKGEAYNAIKDLVLSNTFDTTEESEGVPTYDHAADYTNKIATAAGSDRYATAAEISRKAFPQIEGEADTFLQDEKAIVLVTGEQDKLVDGLTATPLAASLNDGNGAPVLLTGNTKLAQPVIDEINRLGAEKVYIVGGAISESVEKDLERVHGMEVERVSGDDRYETSLEVADEIYAQTDDAAFGNVFVAGGKSEADALSAGAAAARDGEIAPILLTNEDKLNKDVKYFLEGDKVTDAAKVYVVGGNISKSAYNSIIDAHSDNVERLSGDNRQDTNAKVIEEFFAESTNVVVAKSDNKGMVDALGAGLYAGLNDAPVVLATNSLTEDQEDALNNMNITNKLQVGEGIASAVAKFIKDLI